MYFHWNVTEENFHRMMECLTKNISVPSDNCFGNLIVGEICVDFTLNSYLKTQETQEERVLLNTYIYIADANSDYKYGYGVLSDDTPYDLADDWLVEDVDQDSFIEEAGNNYQMFKTICEEKLMRLIRENNWMDHAKAKEPAWNQVAVTY